jgi:hypothetical protein
MNHLTPTQEHDLLSAVTQLVKACKSATITNEKESRIVCAKLQNVERILSRIDDGLCLKILNNTETKYE